MYLLARPAERDKGPRVQLLGSGTILREVIAGADLLANEFGVSADIWSCPSFTELRREGTGGGALEPAASGPSRRARAMSSTASPDARVR